MKWIRKTWAEICEIKDRIQEEGIAAWLNKGGRATLEFYTGFGKTTTAGKCIQRLLNKNPSARIIVVVPTHKLCIDWKEKFPNIEIYVVNSYAKGNWECDLLILDEIHIFSATTFKKTLTNTKAKWILGLTATFKRKDGKHETMNEYAPIAYRLSLEEGERLGIVAVNQYINFNIEFLPEEKERYEEINKGFNNLFAYFEHDMSTMHHCMTNYGARAYYDSHPDVLDLPEKEAVKKLAEYACMCNRYMQQREEFVHKSETKIKLCVELIHKLDLKTIVFGENNSVTDEIATRVNLFGNTDSCKAYHSMNSKKYNELVYSDFQNNYTKYLISSRALIVGIDQKDIACGIDFSYTSSDTELKQKRGRVLRIDKDNLNKVALFINFVLKGTVEEKWTSYKNKEIPRIINVSSIDQVCEIYKTLKDSLNAV